MLCDGVQGYNGYGQLGIGSTSTVKEPRDSNVDLGAGFEAIRVYAGWFHTCAVSALGESKCFGRNNYGQLGIGSTTQRGDGGNEMGDSLVAIDWGTGFKVEDMCLGYYHTCALSTDGVTKCLGRNDYGQLGQGTTTTRGDSTSELGDNLLATELGDDFDTVQLECGSYFTCARSSGGELKCWGEGDHGQLGQGDTFRRGDGSGEMGNSLPAINLGFGFEAATMSAGTEFVCALSTSGTLRCWGENNNGQLGVGDRTDRGTTPALSGDNVPAVDLGSNFTISDVAAGYAFACATSTSGTMKCWGNNGNGQLGQATTTQRGDGGNEMGDYLAEVQFGPGFSASGLRLPGSFGQHFAFAFEESDSAGTLLKGLCALSALSLSDCF